MSLFAELKRRHVVRVAIVYFVAGYAVLEAADLAFPRLGLPDWTVTLVLGLLLIGFPLAVMLAWAFDITPDGLRRTAAPMAAGPSSSRNELSSAGPVTDTPAASARTSLDDRSRSHLVMQVAPWLLVVTGLATLGPIALRPPVEPRVTRSVIPLDGLRLAGRVLITPDARNLVFAASAGGPVMLHVRPLGELATRALGGTEGASSPFLSPDGRWVAFWVDDRLQRVPLEGGRVEELAVVGRTGFRSGTWTSGGEIIVRGDSSLLRLPAEGGPPTPVVTDSAEVGRRCIWPLAAPDGVHLFCVLGGPLGPEDDLLWVVSLETGRALPTALPTREPVTVLDGHLIYRYSGGTVRAAAWDARRGTVAPDSIRVLEASAAVSVAANGTAVYVAADEMRVLRVHAEGVSGELWQAPWPVREFRVSPDGLRAAIVRGGEERELWVVDLATGTPVRLAERGAAPAWTPDGRELVYVIPAPHLGPVREIRARVADGSAPERTLFTTASRSIDFAEPLPGGDSLLVRFRGEPGSVAMISLEGSAEAGLDTREDPLLTARVSPDGRWLAFTTEETGTQEVVVRSLADGTRRVVVSTGGGEDPEWDSRGTSLVYRQGDAFVRARLDTTAALRVSGRDVVLRSATVEAGRGSYHVMPDGGLVLLEPAAGGDRVVLVDGWISELRRQLRDRTSHSASVAG